MICIDQNMMEIYTVILKLLCFTVIGIHLVHLMLSGVRNIYIFPNKFSTPFL